MRRLAATIFNVHCCKIVWNGYNIVPTLQSCVVLKIVVANRPVYLLIINTIHTFNRYEILLEKTPQYLLLIKELIAKTNLLR